jgi:hypothetical protein
VKAKATAARERSTLRAPVEAGLRLLLSHLGSESSRTAWRLSWVAVAFARAEQQQSNLLGFGAAQHHLVILVTQA